jgi:hypothetical protein
MFQGMIRRGESIYQYGILRAKGHGGITFMPGSSGRLSGVCLFEQQADRFVAAEFDYTGGRLLTEPLRFKGNRLKLNVDTGAMGEGRVALLDRDGKPLPGFTLDQCDLINGDWREKTVSWRHGQTDLSALADQPLRLEFRLRGACLYALQFTTD